MPDRSTPSRSTPVPDADVARSTLVGSEAFAKRHLDFEPGFYRQTTFGTTVSSLGIGTYLGDSTDADDEAYERCVDYAIKSGVNLIDTAINYRSQRSERAVGAAIQQALGSGLASRQELTVCSKAGYIPFE